MAVSPALATPALTAASRSHLGQGAHTGAFLPKPDREVSRDWAERNVPGFRLADLVGVVGRGPGAAPRPHTRRAGVLHGCFHALPPAVFSPGAFAEQDGMGRAIGDVFQAVAPVLVRVPADCSAQIARRVDLFGGVDSGLS